MIRAILCFSMAGLLSLAVSVCAEERAAAPPALTLENRVDYLAHNAAREPMLAVHPNGTLFVAGYGSKDTGTDWTVPPLLWKSVDDGKTWTRVNVGSSESGAQGNSDVDLVISPDGTLHFVSLGFNRGTRRGTHVTMGVSRDAGANWQWQMLSQTEFDDRPWVAIAPDGLVHSIWNDGEGVRYARSADAGDTWVDQGRITEVGGSSHMAVGAGGELAVRVSSLSASGNRYDEGADAIAISTDSGDSWQLQAVPGDIEWDPTFSDPEKIMRWVEPVAWGPDSTLHHLWSEGAELYLGRSDDLGETWSQRLLYESAGKAFFPYLVASDRGDLLTTWFEREGSELTGRLAYVDAAGGTAAIAEPLELQAWNGAEPDTAGEYITAAFLPDGDIGVVTTIQDPARDRFGFTFWRFSLR